MFTSERPPNSEGENSFARVGRCTSKDSVPQIPKEKIVGLNLPHCTCQSTSKRLSPNSEGGKQLCTRRSTNTSKDSLPKFRRENSFARVGPQAKTLCPKFRRGNSFALVGVQAKTLSPKSSSERENSWNPPRPTCQSTSKRLSPQSSD